MSTADHPTHITYVRLDALRPHEGNAKMHDVEKLVGLIDRLGFIGSIDIDDRTERIVAGHGRWHALVQMRAGKHRIPRGILVDDDGEWLVPVSRGWASRNREEATAANVGMNRAQEFAGFDDRELSAQLEDLNAEAADLFDLLAYTDEEMDALLRYASGGEDTTTPSPDALAAADDDGDDLDDDMGMTDVPDGPEHETVRCPGCGHRFRPGDKEVY